MKEDPIVESLFGVVQYVRRLSAENERLREALHRIQHSPNGPKVYCRDGHEEAVLIARAALGEEK